MLLEAYQVLENLGVAGDETDTGSAVSLWRQGARGLLAHARAGVEYLREQLASRPSPLGAQPLRVRPLSVRSRPPGRRVSAGRE